MGQKIKIFKTGDQIIAKKHKRTYRFGIHKAC